MDTHLILKWVLLVLISFLFSYQTGFGSDLGDIVRDEIDKLNKKGDGHTCDAKISHDTMLWEYEPSSAAFSELDPEEYEDLMISMQNILYEEAQPDFQNKGNVIFLDRESKFKMFVTTCIILAIKCCIIAEQLYQWFQMMMKCQL